MTTLLLMLSLAPLAPASDKAPAGNQHPLPCVGNLRAAKGGLTCYDDPLAPPEAPALSPDHPRAAETFNLALVDLRAAPLG